MPTSKGSGKPAKKARWSASRKAEAKRARSATRRAKTAGSVTGGSRARRSEGPARGEGRDRPERPERASRPERSEGTGRQRPGRTARPGPERADRPDRRVPARTRADRPERSPRPRPESEDRGRASRPDRPEWKRPERASRPDRPEWKRPERASRPDRPERGTKGRVADPARRDRHEGHHADRFADRGGDRPAEQDRADADHWTAYTSRGTRGSAEVTAGNGFAALGLPGRLVERLARDGITEPFPIQAATIPDALAGRDVLGRGQTGSGKTLAFGLPTLARLAAEGRRAESKRPLVLVLVPTRELAMQVSDALEPLVHVLGLRHRLVAGGLSYEPQISSIARGVELLIATPGRLTDLVERGAVDLGGVETAILDEADHMADMGFLPEVTAILDLVPPGGQRLLFSATLDKGVDTLVERYLVDAVTHSTDDATATVTTMAHHVLLIGPQDKKALTAQLVHRPDRSIVFVRTQMGADRVAHELRERGVLGAALHGGLTQSVRNRVLGAFRDGTVPVLVATDVAARGIDVPDVGLVLQVDPPRDHKDYLHRSGRTARAGEKGTVVTFALPHQKRMMARLVESAGADATTRTVRPGDATIADLGGSEPSGTPVPEQSWRPIVEGRPGRRGGPRGERGRPPRTTDRGRERGGDRGGSRGGARGDQQPRSRGSQRGGPGQNGRGER